MIGFLFSFGVAFLKIMFISFGSFFATWLYDKFLLKDINTLGEIGQKNTAVAWMWSAIYLGNVIMFSLMLFTI